MAPESNNEDLCARRAFKVECARQARLISAGANISYR